MMGLKMKQCLALFLATVFALSSLTAAASDTESEAEDQGLLEDLSDFFSDRAEDISNGVDGITDQVGELADQASSLAGKVKDKASDTAGAAADKLTGAYDAVIDSAGHVVNRTKEGAIKVKDTVQEAIEVIEKNGAKIMEATDKILDYMDLEKPENMLRARESVHKIVNQLYDTHVLEGTISRDGLELAADIAFDTAVYGYLYSQEEISLEEYTSLMSDMIILKGVPAGVGYIAEKLPIPGSGHIAKEVATFIIEHAYKNGEEDKLVSDDTVSETPAESSEETLSQAKIADPLEGESRSAAEPEPKSELSEASAGAELSEVTPETVLPEENTEALKGEMQEDLTGKAPSESEEENPRAILEDPLEDVPLAIVEDPVDDAPMAVLMDP